MYTLNVLGIIVIYDDYNINKIEDIKTIISNNHSLLVSIMQDTKIINLTPRKYDNCLNINDFYEYFDYVVNKIYGNEEMKYRFQDINVIMSFYIEYLIRKNKGESFFSSEKDLNEEMIQTLFAYNYFFEDGNLINFTEYLKYRKDTEKIFEWIKNKYRYSVYNYLLGIITSTLKQYNFDFLENISGIANLMLDQIIIDAASSNYEMASELPKLDIEEIDQYLEEYFDYIKAPDSWKEIYKNLRNNNLIFFGYENIDKSDKSSCFLDSDGILKIYVSNDGTVKTFCSVIHEFIHYLTMYRGFEMDQMSISEFPSIFFEKLAIQFLRNKGYGTTVINKLMDERIENNCDIYAGMSSLFYDINRYLEVGIVTNADKMEFWNNQFNILVQARNKIIQERIANGEVLSTDELRMLNDIDNSNMDLEQSSLEDCDALIESIIHDGIFIIDGFQYLLDTYLSDYVLDIMNMDTTCIEKMIWITNNLEKLTLIDIIRIFDIKELYDGKYKITAKRRKKY